MTAGNHDPAETAEIDQLLAGYATRTDVWVKAMQDQVARRGPDQALANIMLALSLERISPAEMRMLFVLALQRLAAPPPALTVGKDSMTTERTQFIPPDDGDQTTSQPPDDETADEATGEYDTSSLAKEDARNAWQHTAGPDDGTDPEDGADYTIDKKR